MTHQTRTCGQCGTPLVGRVDKRFCSDQCRASATNTRRRGDQAEQQIRKINDTLRRNRNLLRQASPLGKTTLRRQVLEQAGFDFHHFTHLYRTQSGNIYHFCYDYGYLLLSEEKVLIANRQPYMEAG